MSVPDTSILTELRTAFWSAVNGCVALNGKLRKKYQSDQDIQGLITQGVSISDLPALLILPRDFATEMQAYSLEEWPIPYTVELYLPPDRWSTAELLIEQIIWAIRNQAPADNPTVPYTRRLSADVTRVGAVGIKPGTLQQAAPIAGAANQINQQPRCIVATATLAVNPVRNPFA